MRIHFLGTASGLPTPRRFSQTTVLEHAGGLHILDVADGASALLQRQGLRHQAIRSITVSHMHGDHHSGLVQVLKTAMHVGRREPLRIYLPAEAVESYLAFMDLCYLPPEWLGFQIEWLPIHDGSELELDDGLVMRAVANDHLAHARERARTLGRQPATWRFESFSFLLHRSPYTVAYTGNLKASLHEMVPIASGVDVLISEFAHLSLSDCVGALDVMRPKLAIFAHVGPAHDGGCPALGHHGVPGVQVVVAEDGDSYNIGELIGGDVGKSDLLAQ